MGRSITGNPLPGARTIAALPLLRKERVGYWEFSYRLLHSRSRT